MATYKKQLKDQNGDNIIPALGTATVTSTNIDWSTMPGSYSTTEQKTPFTWIDGKPIYRKTVKTGTMPNNTRKQVAHGISNLGFIVSMSGSAYGNNTYLPIPYADTTSASSLGLYASTTDLILFTSANMSYLTTSYVTLYYTKS